MIRDPWIVDVFGAWRHLDGKLGSAFDERPVCWRDAFAVIDDARDARREAEEK